MGILTTSDDSILDHMLSVTQDIIEVGSRQRRPNASVKKAILQIKKAKKLIETTLESIARRTPVNGMPLEVTPLEGRTDIKDSGAWIREVREHIFNTEPLRDRTLIFREFMDAAEQGFDKRTGPLTADGANYLRKKLFINQAARLLTTAEAIDSYIRVVNNTGVYKPLPAAVPGG